MRLPRTSHDHLYADEDDDMDGEDEDDADREELTRDDFNLHKMIVVSTAAGKVSDRGYMLEAR